MMAIMDTTALDLHRVSGHISTNPHSHCSLGCYCDWWSAFLFSVCTARLELPQPNFITRVTNRKPLTVTGGYYILDIHKETEVGVRCWYCHHRTL